MSQISVSSVSSSNGSVKFEAHFSRGNVSNILDISSLMETTKHGPTILDGKITSYVGDQFHSVSNTDVIPVLLCALCTIKWYGSIIDIDGAKHNCCKATWTGLNLFLFGVFINHDIID